MKAQAPSTQVLSSADASPPDRKSVRRRSFTPSATSPKQQSNPIKIFLAAWFTKVFTTFAISTLLLPTLTPSSEGAARQKSISSSKSRPGLLLCRPKKGLKLCAIGEVVISLALLSSCSGGSGKTFWGGEVKSGVGCPTRLPILDTPEGMPMGKTRHAPTLSIFSTARSTAKIVAATWVRAVVKSDGSRHHGRARGEAELAASLVALKALPPRLLPCFCRSDIS